MTTVSEIVNTRLAPGLTGDPSRSVRDVVLLGMRLGAAAVFIPHGRGDIFDAGVSANIANYRDAGIPLPELGAPFAAYIQFLGGIALILGLLTRPIAAGLTVVMGGALIWVHRGEGLVMGQDGSGSGYAFAMGLIALALLVLGPGRLSADHWLTSWWRQRTPARDGRALPAS